MRRFHFFEFGDQPWFPAVLRNAETAYLATAYRMVPLPKLWAEKIATLFRPGEPVEILDLCSGSGGAMPMILDELQKRGWKARATLTDLYPNPKSAPHPCISWVTEPVDATGVPPDLAGVRTMFTAFHHFRPERARAVLKNAFDGRRSICIFEGGSGTLLGMAMILLVPFNVLAVMLFARPFRWSYLVFTYLLPVLPLILLWDGFVSMGRIYSPEQMTDMVTDFRRPDYRWEAGLIPLRGLPDGLPYLIGRPVS